METHGQAARRKRWTACGRVRAGSCASLRGPTSNEIRPSSKRPYWGKDRGRRSCRIAVPCRRCIEASPCVTHLLYGLDGKWNRLLIERGECQAEGICRVRAALQEFLERVLVHDPDELPLDLIGCGVEFF